MSGYIARSSSGNCEACNAILFLDEGLPQIDSLSTQFFYNLDRGGLKKPTDLVMMFCSYSWAIYEEIKSNSFLSTKFSPSKSKLLFIKIVEKCLSDNGERCVTQYEKGHCFFPKIVGKFFNCVMKTFCLNFDTMSTKRKYEKFSCN